MARVVEIYTVVHLITIMRADRLVHLIHHNANLQNVIQGDKSRILVRQQNIHIYEKNNCGLLPNEEWSAR